MRARAKNGVERRKKCVCVKKRKKKKRAPNDDGARMPPVCLARNASAVARPRDTRWCLTRASHELRLFRMLLSPSDTPRSSRRSSPPPPFPSLSFSFRSFRRCIDHLRCLDAYAKYIFYGRTQERLSTEPRGERETSDSRLKRTLITRPRSSSEYSRGPNQEFRDARTFLERDARRKSMDFAPPKIDRTRVLATSTRYEYSLRSVARNE